MWSVLLHCNAIYMYLNETWNTWLYDTAIKYCTIACSEMLPCIIISSFVFYVFVCTNYYIEKNIKTFCIATFLCNIDISLQIVVNQYSIYRYLNLPHWLWVQFWAVNLPISILSCTRYIKAPFSHPITKCKSALPDIKRQKGSPLK